MSGVVVGAGIGWEEEELRLTGRRRGRRMKRRRRTGEGRGGMDNNALSATDSGR